jgi:SAM-dependent methyltransferase
LLLIDGFAAGNDQMNRLASTAIAADYDDWEKLWAPYDEPTYQAVLDYIVSEDVVLEIGAGDLRLARRLAQKARLVYAIEINPKLAPIATGHQPIDNVQKSDLLNGQAQDKNIRLIWADAYQHPFPPGITVGVLLMRHCQNIRLLADKLVGVGARRLITNARWRLGVELVDLLAPRSSYASVQFGWYACWCGATGFVPGPPEKLALELEDKIHEVVGCPTCQRRVGG